MNITVKIKPNSKKEGVIKVDECYEIKVNQPAVEGKANKRMIEVLADYFNVSKSSVKLKYGETSKNKVVEIIGVNNL